MATNGSGLLSRDPAAEALIRQVFTDNVKRDLARRNKIFGLAVLDPVWLYPIGPVRFRKKGILKGTLTACDLRLHNFKVCTPNTLTMRANIIHIIFLVAKYNL